MKINSLSQSIRASLGLGAASLALSFVYVMPVQADVAQWTGANSGDWTNNGNWIIAPPSLGSDVMVTDLISGLNNTVTYSNFGNASAGGTPGTALNSLLVEGTSTTMTLSQHSDSLNAGSLKVGDTGTGAFTQDNSAGAANVSVQSMIIGNNYGASGSYTMTDQSNGNGNALSLIVNGAEVVGQDGVATFVQNGGSNQADSLVVNNDGAQGPDSYTLNQGTLTTGQTNIGNAMNDPSNTSSYNQTGGIASTGAFSMATGCALPSVGGGCAPGSVSYANLSGGSFNVTGLAMVGGGGYAEFNQSGTTVSTINSLIVGAAASSLELDNSLAATGLASQGVVNLSGGSLLVSNSAVIGAGDSTIGNPAMAGIDYGVNGVVNQSGGQLSVGSNLTVGEAGSIVGGQGVYSLSSTGQLAVASTLVVGDEVGNAKGTGVFNQSGGSLNAANMEVGTGGTVNYSGGSFTLDSGVGILTNAGQVNITGSGNQTLFANVINDGSFKVTGTVVEYTGSFTNNGTYHSDPSTNVFNGLTVGTNGYLIGSSGDVFKMQGDFYNNSTSGLWATSAAMLEFTSSPTTTHKMTTMGTAFGQYEWGILQIDSGASLDLNGVYTVGWLDLVDGITQLSMLTGNFTIYYDASLAANGYLAGISDNGHLVAYNTPSNGLNALSVPEPSTWALLVLSLLALLLHRRQSFI
jgi:hypothetical protein